MSEETPTVDELFRVVMIDKIKKVRVNIQLRDEDGDEVPIRETVAKLTEYVSDKMKEEDDNATRLQIIPLMAQAMVGGMTKLLGTDYTSYMLSNEATRYSLVHMMTVGFYLLKFIQNKKIKIHTTEVPITDEDIASLERISRASSIATVATSMGMSPKEVVKKMLSENLVTKEDLEQMGYKEDIEDNNNDKPN